MFRTILRILAYLFLALAILSLIKDVMASINEGALVTSAFGEAWYQISPGTLNLLQAGIQRNLTPFLWDPIFINILLAPSFVVAGVLSLFFFLIFRLGKKKSAIGHGFMGDAL